jgi:hypothetical protein
MRKSRRVKKVVKRRRTYKKKGGECPCAKKGSKELPFMNGGYGAASYQGGLNNSILPINGNLGASTDPTDASNMSSERFMKFNGGKRRRKIKGGLTVDPLLGDSAYTNPVANAGTSVGSMFMVNKVMGK